MKKNIMKISKIVLCFLVIILVTIPNIYAKDGWINFNNYKPPEPSSTGRIGSIGSIIIGAIQYCGSIISIIILITIGIKFIFGSVEEKAEYKMSLKPYLLGAIILFTISSIVGIIKNLMT